MNFDVFDCKLTEKYRLTPTIFDFRLKNKQLADITKAGQFVQVYVPSKTLRRPISVCDVSEDTIRLVFEVRGEGTNLLSQTRIDDNVNVIAPLGNGFVLDADKKTVFVGGGIGVPPLLYSAKQIKKENVTVINGFRNKSAVILSKDFEECIKEIIITTDDGSFGIHGFVTEPLKELVKDGKVEMICACGPTPMLKNVAKIAKDNGIPCQVSLEQRMACGIGACLGCAVAVIDENGRQVYKHVCKDGAVFNAEEVVF